VVLVLHAPHPEAGGLLLSKLGKHCKSAGVRVSSSRFACLVQFRTSKQHHKQQWANVMVLTGDGFNCVVIVKNDV
jgi:hypothetical protein